MTTKEAFQTLQDTAKDQRSKAALQHIREKYARAQAVRSTDQELYLRLYAYLFTALCKHYHEHCGSEMMQKEIHKILDTDYEIWAQDLKDHSNSVIQEYYLKQYNRMPMSIYSQVEVAKNLKFQAMEALLAYTDLRKPEIKTIEPDASPAGL